MYTEDYSDSETGPPLTADDSTKNVMFVNQSIFSAGLKYSEKTRRALREQTPASGHLRSHRENVPPLPPFL